MLNESRRIFEDVTNPLCVNFDLKPYGGAKKDWRRIYILRMATVESCIVICIPTN